jgi:trehalose/maltose hydrolase-like predicted phosphorylase
MMQGNFTQREKFWYLSIQEHVKYACTTRATSALDEATKAALAEKNGKPVLADNTLPDAAKIDMTDTFNNKHPRTKDPHTRR